MSRARHLTMQLRLPIAALLTAPAASSVGVGRSQLDISQHVYIEHQPVLRDGAGEGILNTCQGFARQHVRRTRLRR